MSEQEPTFKSILQDQSFYALLRLSQRKALTWDTFLQHPLPSNMSPLAVWDTLELIGRCTGIHLFEDDENNLLWYRRTHELGDLVDNIEQRVAYGSSFSDVLLYHTDRSFLLELRLSELAGTLELSGLSVDLAHLKIGARLEATSHHPVEKIAANALSIDQDLHAYAQEPFSHALFDRMYDQLVEGVGADEISTLSSSAGNQAIDEQKWSALRKQLDHVVTYANNKIDDEDLVVMQGNVIAGTIRYYEIFGFASSLMGSLASR